MVKLHHGCSSIKWAVICGVRPSIGRRSVPKKMMPPFEPHSASLSGRVPLLFIKKPEQRVRRGFLLCGGQQRDEASERNPSPALHTSRCFHSDLGDQPHPCCYGYTDARGPFPPADWSRRELKKCKEGFVGEVNEGKRRTRRYF